MFYKILLECHHFRAFYLCEKSLIYPHIPEDLFLPHNLHLVPQGVLLHLDFEGKNWLLHY